MLVAIIIITLLQPDIWGEPERAPYGIEKRPPRTIYLSMYLCMRTSFRKCPRALIHWTVQYFIAVNF